MSQPPVRITRSVRFSAAHRYHNPSLSADENRALFGPCNREHGHGHNYRVDMTVEGDVDPVTGMVMNLVDIDALLKAHVVSRLDHSFLNHDVEHFAETIPTCEELARWLYGELAPRVGEAGHRLAALRVWESDDLWAEVAP